MNGLIYNQAPSVITVAKHAGAAFIVGAAGSTGVVVGVGVGGMILGSIAKKKLVGLLLDIKRGFNS